MATSYLVDQTGWEEKVMLTHFGMVTNGRQTSDTRKHIEDTKILCFTLAVNSLSCWRVERLSGLKEDLDTSWAVPQVFLFLFSVLVGESLRRAH